MADQDEDIIPTISSSSSISNNHNNNATTDSDLEDDETVDFRFLQSNIPKRGTKDFEPNTTRSQANTLELSRTAMQTALSVMRIHHGKNHIIGQYFSSSSSTNTSQRKGRCVVIYKFKSTHSRLIGQADQRNWTWLYSEEALYLLERGSLDLRFDLDSDVDDLSIEKIEKEKEEEGKELIGDIPMSLQGGYACLIGRDGLTLERYLVYANLKRSGYVVQRSSTWDDEEEVDKENVNVIDSAEMNRQITTSISNSGGLNLIYRLISWLFRSPRQQTCPTSGPLIAPGLYRSYADIFRALTLIPTYTTPTAEPSKTKKPKSPYRVTYDIWKPNNTSYRKSNPPAPDYRVVVLDARSSSMPKMEQIGDLLDSMPLDDLSSTGQNKRMETRLKHGKRNVLVAIVDSGVISYLRFSDAQFGSIKLYEERNRGGPGYKGKGRRFGGK